MSTKAEVRKSILAAQFPVQLRPAIWAIVLTSVMVGAWIGASVLSMQRGGNELSDDQRALTAMTARYQGLASYYAAIKVAKSRGHQAEAARYQGLADYYAAKQVIELDRAWLTVAKRYEALAKSYLVQGR